MDLQAIYAALASTLSPNQQERQAAEAALKGWEGQPGYVSSLFRVVNSQEVAVEVRQAGIVYFKNIVNKHWERDEPVVGGTPDQQWVIGEDERAFVRSNIVDAMVQADAKCRPVIAESLRRIASNDFPVKMPNLLQEITQRLDVSVPPDQILGALLALRVLTKNFEYASVREPPYSRRRFLRRWRWHQLVCPWFSLFIVRLCCVWSNLSRARPVPDGEAQRALADDLASHLSAHGGAHAGDIFSTVRR